MKLQREDSEIFGNSPNFCEEPRFLDTGDEADEEETDDLFSGADVFPNNNEKFIFKLAIKSRAAVFLIGLLSTSAIGTFDSSSSLLSPSSIYPLPFLCPSNWDGTFNVNIASDGYKYEESHAFFPLFPLACSLIRRAISFIFNHHEEANDYIWMGILGAVLNNVLFVCSAVLFYRLSTQIFAQRIEINKQAQRIAMRASILFCFNPASIFFSVAYSESLFSVLTFAGLVVLFRKGEDEEFSFASRLGAACCFSLATLTRSNGSLLGLFTLYACYRRFHTGNQSYIMAVVQLAILGGIQLLALLFVLGYGYVLYCQQGENTRPWCSQVPPNIYSFVQAKYWNVGFLTYYEMAQLPNFLLASPAIVISFSALRTRDLVPPVFWAQLLCSLVVGCFFMHVQVFTRLVCASCPLFFWHCAELTMRKHHQANTSLSYFILLYFSFYFMLGTTMFCSYFPWT